MQNRASRFYDNWTVSGFEGSETGGFAGARQIHLDPLQDSLEDLRELSGEVEELEPSLDTFADYTQIVNTVDVFEQTVLQMSDQMESLGQYLEESAAATDVHLKLQANRASLVSQSDEMNSLVNSLLGKQQAKLKTAVENVQERRTSAIITVVGLTLLTLFASATAASFVAGKVIQPLRELGETASQLGAGDVAVRATVHGRDEIGATASAFNLMADRLGELLSSLEQQVADRTRDLTRRTAYLEASAEVGRAASSILETDELLRQVVELIRAQFDLYYVGLFLRDASGDSALLRAGTGQAGRVMLARGHRIPEGQGMIGWSITNAEARVASDAGDDVIRLATVELPETRSEAAIPLRSRGQVLGALSVQATQPDAFDQAAVFVLQSMADQVAVAVDNARLYTASQEALETARRAYGDLGRAEWASLIRRRSDLGYRSDDQGTVTVDSQDPWRPETEHAYRSGEAVKGNAHDRKVQSSPDSATRRPLAVPIQAHGQVIGVIDTFKQGGSGDWTPDEIDVIQEITAQLALALDNARLHQETQRRAVREQLAREITEKVRAAPDVESIAATAAEELVKALGGSRGFVTLRADSASIADTDGPDGTPDSENGQG